MSCYNDFFYTESGRFPPANPSFCRYANEMNSVHYWVLSDEFDGYTCSHCCKIASSKIMKAIAFQRLTHNDYIFEQYVSDFYKSNRRDLLTFEQLEILYQRMEEDLQQKDVTVVVEVVKKYDAKAVNASKAAEKSAKATEKSAKAAEKSAKAVQKFLVTAKVAEVAKPVAKAIEAKLVASKPATVVSDNHVPTLTKEHVQRARAATAKMWTKQRKQAAAVKAGL